MRKRILFVDDEDWSVTPYFEKLRDHDIDVDLAVNGDEAIDQLRKNKYDLLVLDIMLQSGKIIGKDDEPRKAGATLLEMIRKNEIPDLKTKTNVPVVILTAVTDEKLLDDINQFNVNKVFRKPVSFNEVTDQLLEVINSNPVE